MPHLNIYLLAYMHIFIHLTSLINLIFGTGIVVFVAALDYSTIRLIYIVAFHLAHQ